VHKITPVVMLCVLLQSHEVSSFQEEEVEQHAIPEEWIAEVAELLQSLEPDNLQGAAVDRILLVQRTRAAV
jgi:hypothetical protein